MTKYLVRIVLHNANYFHYERLHEEMANVGFRRTIVGRSGKTYELPDATYIGEINLSPKDTVQLAKRACHAVGRRSGVLVTKASGTTWSGLIQAVDDDGEDDDID